MASVLAVQGQVDNGTPTLLQSCQAMPSLSMSLSLPTATVTPSTLAHAVAAELLDIRDPVAVDSTAVGPLEAAADGVGGGALRQSGVFQHFLPGQWCDARR